jgi:hypothetical protein
MVGWSLLTDFGAIERAAIKRARVPILRSLNIQVRLKQQARKQGKRLQQIPSLACRVMIDGNSKRPN